MLTRVAALAASVFILLPGVRAFADDAVTPPDTDILKRTPLIDGVIEDGEWDTFYSISSEGWEATATANWDNRNLYVGARSNKPIDLLAVLDANADGWFHGDENYEFQAMRSGDGNVAVTVSRYESRNIKTPSAAPVSPGEAALVELRSGKSGDDYAVEMRVPAALVRGYRLTDGKKIGLRIALKTEEGDSGWVPAGPVGDTRECRLVTRKFATLKPLEVGFDIKETTVARGEELSGKFHLTNSGNETLNVREFVLAGEGKSGDYLSSQKVRIESLAPKKHVSHGFRTLIPRDMPTGSWALGAEVSSADGRLGAALVSFDVVDPFEIELRIPTAPVPADAKDVSFTIAVYNYTRGNLRGEAKITLPIGWELWREADKREFSVRPGGAVTPVLFKAKPPLGEMGEVSVKAEVTVGGETKTAEGRFTVLSP